MWFCDLVVMLRNKISINKKRFSVVGIWLLVVLWNKTSINKNALVLSGCFVVWLIALLIHSTNHKTTKQPNNNIKLKSLRLFYSIFLIK